MSARDGLAAKQFGDAQAASASGIAAFEEALVAFLINDKSREFLLRMIDRIRGVLRDLPQPEEAARLRDQLDGLARQIDSNPATAVPLGALGPAGIAASVQIRPCEICTQAAHQGFDFLRKYQYDITVSPEWQGDLADRDGLCSFHTWIYEFVASPHGACVGFAAVLDRLAGQLQSAGASPRVPVPGPGPCIVCKARAAAESAAVRSVAAWLQHTPDDALASLSDVCLPHFRLLGAAVADADVLAKLFARQATLLQRVAEDMRRVALKHEGVRRWLASDEETRAAQRALLLLAGHRTLNMPSPCR